MEIHCCHKSSASGTSVKKFHPKDYQQKLIILIVTHPSTNRGRCCLIPLYQAVDCSNIPITTDRKAQMLTHKKRRNVILTFLSVSLIVSILSPRKTPNPATNVHKTVGAPIVWKLQETRGITLPQDWYIENRYMKKKKKKKKKIYTKLIQKGNSYWRRKSSAKPWSKVSSEGLSTKIDILIRSPIQVQTEADVA